MTHNFSEIAKAEIALENAALAFEALVGDGCFTVSIITEMAKDARIDYIERQVLHILDGGMTESLLKDEFADIKARELSPRKRLQEAMI